jgi:hypothetical protein
VVDFLFDCWIAQVFDEVQEVRYIAVISTGHQRNGIDDITSFFSLSKFQVCWRYLDLLKAWFIENNSRIFFYARLMNRQKMNFCFTPEGVKWSSTRASAKMKLSPSSLCRVSGLYLTTESPLHFGGASRLKVAIIRCPFSFKAWLSEFIYPFLSSAFVRK